MSDKEVKQWLKDALENIKKKDHDLALKYLKKVLSRDKNNYKALIFCGLCLTELEQSEKALQVGALARTCPPSPDVHTGYRPGTRPGRGMEGPG